MTAQICVQISGVSGVVPPFVLSRSKKDHIGKPVKQDLLVLKLPVGDAMSFQLPY